MRRLIDFFWIAPLKLTFSFEEIAGDLHFGRD